MAANCRPDHAAAEQLGLEAELVGRLDHAGRVRRVGADIDHVRIGRLDGADDRREIGRGRRIGLVVDDLEAHLLRVLARAGSRILRELGVGRGQRDGLQALALGELEEAARPVLLGNGACRHDLEVAVVLELVVDSEAEQRREHHLLAHDDGHRRHDHVGAVAGDDQVDLIDLEQLGVERRNLRRVRLVVVVDELDRPAEQAALGIDVVAPDFHGDQGRLAAGTERPGERHGEADLDRLLLREGRGDDEGGDR